MDISLELDIYRPRWSSEILDEMERALVRTGAVTPSRCASLRIALTNVFPDAEVNGYEFLTPAMAVHAKDRHVLAAAVHCGAEVLVTDNLKDFPVDACARVGVQVLSADRFLTRCYDTHPDLTGVVRGVPRRYGKYGAAVSWNEFIGRLSLVTPTFAHRLRGDG